MGRAARPSESRYLPARELPKGFPSDLVPILYGRLTDVSRDESAGAPPGKKAWALEVHVGGSVAECYDRAVAALRDKGLEKGREYSSGLGRQSFFRLKSKTFRLVVVSAMDFHDGSGCVLTYVVGPNGLRMAG